MKSVIFYLLVCTSLFCSHSLYAKGKTTPKSSSRADVASATGPTSTACTSSATTTSASFGVNPIPINFQIDLVTPLGITHPVSGNFAQFQVANSGVYQLFWTINVLWPQSGNCPFTTVVIDLIKAMPLTSVSVVTMQNNENGGENAQLFGQMIVSLEAEETVYLQIFNTQGQNLEISPQSIFTISQLTP